MVYLWRLAGPVTPVSLGVSLFLVQGASQHLAGQRSRVFPVLQQHLSVDDHVSQCRSAPCLTCISPPGNSYIGSLGLEPTVSGSKMVMSAAFPA